MIVNGVIINYIFRRGQQDRKLRIIFWVRLSNIASRKVKRNKIIPIERSVWGMYQYLMIDCLANYVCGSHHGEAMGGVALNCLERVKKKKKIKYNRVRKKKKPKPFK